MTPPDYAAARRISAIPVIDVSRLIHGEGIEEVAVEIHTAATEVGFFYIAGHGIDRGLIENGFRAARRFFALPTADKETVAVNTSQRGWMAQGMTRLHGAKTHDLKEVFFWGSETNANDPDLLAGKPLVAENQWPSAVFPELEAAIRPYHDALCAVARKVMSAIAVSLNQPPDFFDPAYAKPLARGQLVYYPPSTAQDEAEERFGVAPHTDFGVLTFLLQDQSGGLQVRLKSGEWAEAPPIEGTLVCNIGDLLARWTNDRFASTVHRVINRSAGARFSIPIFFDPHTETVIDPRDLGTPPGQSRYEPVTAGAHIMGRNKKSFSQFKDAS